MLDEIVWDKGTISKSRLWLDFLLVSSKVIDIREALQQISTLDNIFFYH